MEVDLVSMWSSHGGHRCLGVERASRQLLYSPVRGHMPHEEGRDISGGLKRLAYCAGCLVLSSLTEAASYEWEKDLGASGRNMAMLLRWLWTAKTSTLQRVPHMSEHRACCPVVLCDVSAMVAWPTWEGACKHSVLSPPPGTSSSTWPLNPFIPWNVWVQHFWGSLASWVCC